MRLDSVGHLEPVVEDLIVQLRKQQDSAAAAWGWDWMDESCVPAVVSERNVERLVNLWIKMMIPRK